MKSPITTTLAALFALTAVASAAHADIFPGKINYTECARTVNIQGGPALDSVCFGTKVGMPGVLFIFLNSKNLAPTELRVVDRSPINGGINPLSYGYLVRAVAQNGTMASGVVFRMHAPNQSQATDRTSSLTLDFAGAHINAATFQFMMNSM